MPSVTAASDTGAITLWSFNIVNGGASLTTATGDFRIAGPDAGTLFLNIATSSSPIITFTQVTSLQAGQKVRCRAAYNNPGDGDALQEAVQVTMFVDGQFSNQVQSLLTPMAGRRSPSRIRLR
jgi:hypothetical protein